MADSCPSPVAVIYSFGPFEFDPQDGGLRRNGRRIDLPLQRQKILAMLLERPGELVTRDAIRQRIWPPDTFVDFDNSLNVAVNRIRQTLRDSADQPLYIETHARLGYRFIAPVNVRVKGVAPPAETTPESENGDSQPESSAPRNESRPFSIGWLLPAAMLAVAALAAASLWFLAPRWPHVVSFRQITYDRDLKSGPGNPAAVLTDGGRLYFSESTAHGWRLMSAGLDEVGPIPFNSSVPSLQLQDLSPDGLRLLAVRPSDQGSQLYIIRQPGGEMRPVQNVRARAACWSPHGHRIVYSWRRELFLMQADGTDVKRLTTLPSTPWWIRWSPASDVVRFTLGSFDSDNTRLWQYELGQAAAHPVSLPGGLRNACCGSWSAGGDDYFFQATHHGPDQIYVWPRHARQPHPLIASPFNMTAPAPLGHHRLLAIGQSMQAQVLRWNSRQHQFEPLLGGIPADWVTYSPDGRHVAYIQVSATRGEHNTWLARSDGTHARQITFFPRQCEGLAWAPHGRRLLIRERTGPNPWQIDLYTLRSGQIRRLPHTENAGIPTWQPDGRHFAYGDLPGASGKFPARSALHVDDLRTGSRQTIPGSDGFWTVRWSPDGQWIAALQEKSQQLELFSVLHGKWRSFPIAGIVNLTWTHDGHALYFDTTGSHAALYRLGLPGDRLQRITKLTGVGWLEDGWSGLSIDDQPLITRQYGLSEIYSLRWRSSRSLW